MARGTRPGRFGAAEGTALDPVVLRLQQLTAHRSSIAYRIDGWLRALQGPVVSKIHSNLLFA